MAKNVAAQMKAKEVKVASKSVMKRLAAQMESIDAEPVLTQAGEVSAFGALAASQLGQQGRRGIDSPQPGVVHSGFSSTQTTEGTIMTEKTKQELDAEKAAAKIAAKAEKEAEKQAKKAAAQAEREAKIKERDELMAKRKAEREAAIAAAGDKPPRERTYVGSMLALADRVKAGQYVKGTNGQLRSNDEVAQALDSVPAKKVVPLLLEVLKMPNIYAAKGLNYGQQSMNLRNRLRGALRQGTEVGEGEAKVKVTLDYVKQVRDDGGYATAEAEAAEKAAKKAKAEEAVTAA